MTETVEFNSCGDVCKGILTRPGVNSSNVPLVIMAGGWCYTKEIVMPWYAKFFRRPRVRHSTLRLSPLRRKRWPAQATYQSMGSDRRLPECAKLCGNNTWHR